MNNDKRLFNASCFALVTTAMTFAVRAKIELVFNNDYGLTLEQIGIAFGPAFYGFTLAMIIGGFLVDLFGMKKIMNLAFIGHLVGIVLTLFARDFWMLFSGTLLIGIGNGMVEAACNPLIATLYPKEKTKMLNRFHVWFPGGIVIGSILGYLIVDIMGMSWMVLVGTLIVPLVIYIYLFKGQEFPATERVAKSGHPIPLPVILGLYALEEILVDLSKQGKTIYLVDLQKQPRYMMERVEMVPKLIPQDNIYDNYKKCFAFIKKTH